MSLNYVKLSSNCPMLKLINKSVYIIPTLENPKTTDRLIIIKFTAAKYTIIPM